MELPSRAGIEAAASSLKEVLPESPLYRSEGLSRLLGAEVWLKNETASAIACFKLRGAFVELHRARARGALGGAVTSSTGNHGRGVAYAARLLGVPAHIFLPLGPNPLKRSMIEALGARIHEGGADIDEAKALARIFCEREGFVFVDDGESLGVMEGAATVGWEIGQRLPEVDQLFVPMGSGSLAAGCACALKALQPGARVVAASAQASPAMAESFLARRAVERPVRSEAEGLACRVPAALALEALLEFVDQVALTSDAELLSGVRVLAGQAQILAELSAAAAWAAAWQQRTELKERRVVIVVSGGNITLETLRRALSHSD